MSGQRWKLVRTTNPQRQGALVRVISKAIISNLAGHVTCTMRWSRSRVGWCILRIHLTRFVPNANSCPTSSACKMVYIRRISEIIEVLHSLAQFCVTIDQMFRMHNELRFWRLGPRREALNAKNRSEAWNSKCKGTDEMSDWNFQIWYPSLRCSIFREMAEEAHNSTEELSADYRLRSKAFPHVYGWQWRPGI